ncbi:MAG TPA: hypothetical protein DCY20_03355 [Firmicutes bacterium]|nr:hypothetical protein [Bacillota bacterium]
MRRKKKPAEGGGSTWIVTFSDLMTLLLCFFIMLFAMSSIEDEKYQIIINSIQNALVGSNGETIFDNPSVEDKDLLNEISPEEGNTDAEFPFPSQNPNKNESEGDEVVDGEIELEVEKDETEIDEEMKELHGIVVGYLTGQGLESDVKVEIVEEGILLDIKETIFFDMGKAEIKPQSLSTLDRLGTLFDKFDNAVRIIGHTDNVPINTNNFPSNWELAAARSCAVVRYYTIKGANPTRFTCTSYGEYYPIASNDTEEGRAENRRVNFLIEASPEEIKKLADVIVGE